MTDSSQECAMCRVQDRILVAPGEQSPTAGLEPESAESRISDQQRLPRPVPNLSPSLDATHSALRQGYASRVDRGSGMEQRLGTGCSIRNMSERREAGGEGEGGEVEEDGVGERAVQANDDSTSR